ncbi:probable cytochrome P450 308a1 [Drosophila subpulchrella]|uniref:probable cytochrome P450 308a1 n=1 Tax=Drosophila subpulchrella TaxID=1486046 RepID=UPI0018A1AB12|nr:probable cytochrome P450 308a1 [Drosophila subpulchrella]
MQVEWECAFSARDPSMLLPVLLCLLLVATLLLWIWQGNHWRRLGLQAPFGWPLVGNMLDFALARRSYGEVYEQIYRQNPGLKYVGFYRLFNEPAILVRDQELVRHILVGKHFGDCADNAVNVDHHRDVLASHNPFIANGDRWRLLRTDLVALFTPSRVRQTLPHVARACQLLRARVPLDRFEAKDLATRFTLQVVASAVFGLDAHCLCGQNVEETSNRWLKWLAPLFQPSPWSLLETIALLHSPRLARLIGHRYVPLPLQNWFGELVDARSGGDNLLQWLAEGKRTLGRDELAGHATTLLLEGYETSAMLLAFALYELALNKDAQRNLHCELDEVAQRHNDNLMDHVALAELRYTEAALLEALRLHPAMQALQKRCTKSFTLPAQKYGSADDLRVSLGTVLVLPVQAIHLDPELYPEPNQFRPERFLNQPPMGCRFLGFGFGPRMCPGMRLGLLQTKAALATLLQDHCVLLSDQDQSRVEVSPLTFLTAGKGGIWLRLERRTSE